MQDLHKIQMLILKELLYHPTARFTDLNLTGLSNDHFSYHINTLIKLKFVEKTNGKYSLSQLGKKYAGLIDTLAEKVQIEKQGKVGALVILEREFRGKKQYIWQKRLKEPYYGYYGFFTGKIKFGETVLDAAAREIKEETGLEADLEHRFVLHEMVYNNNGDMLEDKYFNIVYAFNPRGKLTNTNDGENRWITPKEMKEITPQYHNELEIYDLFKNNQREFIERKYIIESF
jgi:8-oxo-dGTP pyrophosphatase MutT (NUDIX family)